jgi:hypothetical protein
MEPKYRHIINDVRHPFLWASMGYARHVDARRYGAVAKGGHFPAMGGCANKTPASFFGEAGDTPGGVAESGLRHPIVNRAEKVATPPSTRGFESRPLRTFAERLIRPLPPPLCRKPEQTSSPSPLA